MRDLLVGHLLDALEPDEQRLIEEKLAEDPELRRQMDLLRAGLQVLEPDKSPYPAPLGLARRACAFVAGHTRPCLSAVAEEMPFANPRFRWHDFVVAAGIFVAASMLFFPAVSHSKRLAQQTGCQNNLRILGTALAQYAEADKNHMFPVVQPSGPAGVAGVYAPALISAGFLTDARRVICPGCSLGQDPEFQVPTMGQLARATPEDLERWHRVMGGSYGYTLGHMEGKRYVGTRNQSRPTFALLADTPCPNSHLRASRNHGRCGQNVLFEDMHVALVSGGRVPAPNHPGTPEDDLYMNDDGELAPGKNRDDSVCASSNVGVQMPTYLAAEEVEENNE